MTGRPYRFPGILSVLAFLALAGCSSAPKPTPLKPQMVGPHDATRGQLEAKKDSLERAIAAVGGPQNDTVSADRLAIVERRLTVGDFDVGDVIFLTVFGEERWSDTFTVMQGQTVDLPDIPAISLVGALYSEGEEVVREDLSRYLREPEVRMRVTKKIAILGGVGAPGFYDVPGATLLSEAIMLAGGPDPTVNWNRVELKRDGKALYNIQASTAQVMTLDDVGVLSGDELNIPSAATTNVVLRNIGIVVGLLAGITGLVAIIVN